MTTIDRLRELERDMRKETHNLIASNYLSLEDLSECIESLEKQTSKKPKHVTKKEVYDPDRPFATIDVTTFVCPCCGVKIMFRKTIQRCLECGQKLDWSDEE